MNRPDRPRVIANFARTADGKISTRNFTASGFTSDFDLLRLLEIRALGDAVLVGRNTLAADTMSMTLRDQDLRERRLADGRSPEPLRVIISGSGHLDSKWKVFQTDGGRRVVFSTLAMPIATRDALAPLADLHLAPNGVDIRDVLRTLRTQYAVQTLVCEGGGMLFRSLIEIHAVDQLYVTFGPVVFGGSEAPTLTGVATEFFSSPIRLTMQTMEIVGEECYVSYLVDPV